MENTFCIRSLIRIRSLAGLATLAGLSLIASPAAAQATYFPDDATINYATPTDAFVGYNTSLVPSSPTVNLVLGGLIQGDLQIYNGSILNVTGGSVDDILQSLDTSTVNLRSGSVGSFLYATMNSTANVSGGSVSSYLCAIDSSTVSVSGGKFGSEKGVNFVDSTTGLFAFAGPSLSYALDPLGLTPFGGTDYTLTGLLQNGDSVTGDVIEVASGARMFTLSTPVPEASTAAGFSLGLLCFAGLIFRARRFCRPPAN